MGEADGQEVLVVDADEKVQRGLAQLLVSSGLVPTVMAEGARACALAKEKYFPVALVDLDTPQPNAGLDLVRWLKREAPLTSVFVMASRKVFEAAVGAFRAGASDVVVKAPDQVEYLRSRVVDACVNSRSRASDDRLINDVLAVHEEFLRRLMDSQRRVGELEEQLGGGSHPSEGDLECGVLVVEPYDGDWLASQLAELLRAREGYTLRTAGSGGEALDLASREKFEIALICDTLPDLPGSMVLSAFKTNSPETIRILYSRPGALPGKAEVIEGSHPIALLPEFTEVNQIVVRFDELREAARRTRRERRYLAAFRQENYELLRRYAELKQKLTRAAK
jgi:DNA-binding NtrC family response regulator